MKVIDLSGERFGIWTVIALAERSATGKVRWHCVCDCGADGVVHAANLRGGVSTSCGCTRPIGVRKATATHGMSKTRVYEIWSSMLKRCRNPNNQGWMHYGGRGIRVSPEWDTFEAFYRDMGEPPTEKHSIDRIDNDGGYCKENCRWVEQFIQAINKRKTTANTSGVTGVRRHGNAWRAELRVYGEIVLRKAFRNKDDAISARKEAETLYHEPARRQG